MKTRHPFLGLLLASAAVVFSGGLQAANLLLNGDFESGDTGFTTDYSPGSVTSIAGIYSVTTTPPVAWAPGLGDHTSGSGNMAIYNGSTNAGDRMWTQTVSLAAGMEYVFSGYVVNLTENLVPGVPPILQLRVDGTPQGSPVTGPSSDDTWEFFSITWTSAVTGPVSLALHDLETASEGNDFAIDDLNLAPEPSRAFLSLVSIAAINPLHPGAVDCGDGMG